MANLLTGFAKGFVDSANQAYADQRKSKHEELLRQRTMEDWKTQTTFKNDIDRKNAEDDATRNMQVNVQQTATIADMNAARTKAANEEFLNSMGITDVKQRQRLTGLTPEQIVAVTNNNEWDADGGVYVHPDILKQRRMLASVDAYVKGTPYEGSPYHQSLREGAMNGRTIDQMTAAGWQPEERDNPDKPGTKTFYGKFVNPDDFVHKSDSTSHQPDKPTKELTKPILDAITAATLNSQYAYNPLLAKSGITLAPNGTDVNGNTMFTVTGANKEFDDWASKVGELTATLFRTDEYGTVQAANNAARKLIGDYKPPAPAAPDTGTGSPNPTTPKYTPEQLQQLTTGAGEVISMSEAEFRNENPEDVKKLVQKLRDAGLNNQANLIEKRIPPLSAAPGQKSVDDAGAVVGKVTDAFRNQVQQGGDYLTEGLAAQGKANVEAGNDLMNAVKHLLGINGN